MLVVSVRGEKRAILRVAWTVLLISAMTDFFITSGTAWVTFASTGQSPTKMAIATMIVGGLIAAARTIQQALKSTPETAAALKGDFSTTATATVAKTP